MSSIKTYIGFAVKSGANIKGADDIIKTRKKVALILVEKDLKENSRKKIEEFSNKKNIPILEVEVGLLNELNLRGVKILAITDENLANAVKKCIN